MFKESQTHLSAFVHRRDAHAFGRLVDQYQSLVVNVCQRRLIDREDAEDVAQEVFTALATSAGSIHGDVAAWLHRCALNKCQTLNQKRKSERLRLRARADMQQAGSKPEEHLVQARACLDDSIEELPTPQRKLILQHFFEGQTQKQLAAQERVSQPMISKRMTNAIEALRRGLARRGCALPAAGVATLLSVEMARSEVAPSVTEKFKLVGQTAIQAHARTLGLHAAKVAVLAHGKLLIAAAAVCGVAALIGLSGSSAPDPVKPVVASTSPASDSPERFKMEFYHRDGPALVENVLLQGLVPPDSQDESAVRQVMHRLVKAQLEGDEKMTATLDYGRYSLDLKSSLIAQHVARIRLETLAESKWGQRGKEVLTGPPASALADSLKKLDQEIDHFRMMERPDHNRMEVFRAAPQQAGPQEHVAQSAFLRGPNGWVWLCDYEEDRILILVDGKSVTDTGWILTEALRKAADDVAAGKLTARDQVFLAIRDYAQELARTSQQSVNLSSK